ncbi:phosphoglucomutase [Virgibacillus natechei]|uniref:Phosphoglucomutase n=1 Tax=Virgibacillus natechei TaxID=1216297 RepID=A0ABS4IIH9_9BACI|nr:phospho-sugar mutase [Virgibacillus natechei]MBP1969789.1 phosphoglucomutase [Virgibacillus natechei]UZD12674.1 phospho-sugar mutase [Virgibacillus natechei]
MSSWKNVYQKWDSFQKLDPSLKSELEKIKDHKVELEDAFYKELTFGTGGMRGVLGAGTNRMNIYTVRKAVNGLANYLLANRVNVKDRGVVIAYDSRYMSQEFAIEAATVLGAYGIKASVFDAIRPTPLLSYAVRHLGTVAGIMITASHNPPEYNGFKVYNEDGGQITPDEATEIIEAIEETENELTVPVMEQEEMEERELLHWINDEIDNAYLVELQRISRMEPEEQKQDKGLPIVFTPLHGTANNLVMKGLEQLNFSHVDVVEEQVKPDPEFSTVESPNPEEHQAFTYAIKQGQKSNASILLATDPDGDRLGVAVKNSSGDYQVLTGNQLGALLLDYNLAHSDPIVLKTARMLKTVVTTELGRAIADSYNVETIDTLTGFKYIGEKIRQFDATGETFVFGFEESYGYLISSFARDKDAVQAAVMACEMAYYWEKQGKTLLDALSDLYVKHGYYLEGMSSLTLKGKEGSDQIATIMDEIRHNPLTEIAGVKVEQIEDYEVGERTLLNEGAKKEAIQLPNENMMKFVLEQDSWVCLRPSGTEPKIKCYYGVRGETSADSEQKLASLKEDMDQIIHEIRSFSEK